MATDAVRRPIAIDTRRGNPAWDRVFCSVMIFAMWATVLFGFAKTYFLAGMVAAPLPNKLIHIHGAAFTLWMVLLVVQEVFVSTRRIQWHRTLGWAGFVLAVAMVVLGLLAATDAMRRGEAPMGLTPKTFYVVPVSDMLVFAPLVYRAYRARRKPAVHKRLILLATIGLMDAGVGRWPIAYLQANPKSQDLVILLFLLAMVGYDLLSTRRVQRVTLWGSVFVAVVHAVRVPLAFTAPWQAFATKMLGHS